MESTIDVTKLPGYRPEWSYKGKPEEPPPDNKRTVPKIISARAARRLTAAYHCAACWSPLKVYWHLGGEYAGNYTVECEYCGGDVSGFVTRAYIAHRITQNEEDYREAKLALQESTPFLFFEQVKHERKSIGKNLSQLGF